MQLVAVTPGLPIIGLAIAAPTLVVLFVSSYLFAKTRQKRMAILIAGFVFAVIAIVATVFLFSPSPNSWADENFGWIVIGIAPIGAALGVLLAIGYQFAAQCRAT
jgi:membrane-associated HD superfamily phosphohydrolase